MCVTIEKLQNGGGGVMYVLVHIGRIKNVVAVTVKVAELSRYVHISYLSVYFVLRVSECG